MILRLRRIAAAGACALIAACGGGNTSSATDTAPVPPAQSLGLMKITISGIGSGQMSSKVELVQGGSAGRIKAAMPSIVPNGLDVEQISASTEDIGSPGTGTRYFDVVYQVRNAEFCDTPGTCTPYATASNNLTLIAANTATNIDNTAITNISLYDGTSSPATQALATSLLPTHGMQFDSATGTAGGLIVQPGLESLQVFTEDEVSVASIARDPGATDLFPYGYVVRNIHTAASRSLPASPANQQFDGQVSFSFKLPLQADPKNDPYSVSLIFQVIDDANTRVTESAEEQNFAGDIAAELRAATLGSTDLVVLSGRLVQTPIGDPICTVRTAGAAVTPPAAPAAYLVNNYGDTFASAPFNLEFLSHSAAFDFGFCAPVNSAGFGNLVISGSQSGLRTAGGKYTGSYSANASGTVATFTPAKAFLLGETVSYTLTSGFKYADGTARAPFVGSFTVGSGVAAPGVFDAPVNYGVGDEPGAVAVGDFNGDGIPDLAVSYEEDAPSSLNPAAGYVAILLGSSSSPGTFAAAVSYGVGSDQYAEPNAVAVGDFNGDGIPDLAVSNFGDNSVSILLGSSSSPGTFAAAVNYPVGTNPKSIAVGDFNGDGIPDLAVANEGGNSVSILLGSATSPGSFAAAVNYPVVTGLYNGNPYDGDPYSLAVGDFNGDGILDLAVAVGVNRGPDASVAVLLGSSSNPGTFAAPVNYAIGGSAPFVQPIYVAVGDFNGDGIPDLAVSYAETLTGQSGTFIAILLGSSTSRGTFAAPVYYSTNGIGRLVVGDFNGDGIPDLAVANANVSILLGSATQRGTFGAPANYAVGSTSTPDPVSIAVGDFNGDGIADLVTANGAGNASVLLGQP